MKHTRYIIALLIALFAIAIVPTFAQDYGGSTTTTPVVETPSVPDWSLIDTPAGYAVFAKAGYSFLTYTTHGRGITVVWFSVADVESCDSLLSFRVTDGGTLSEESWIQKCIETTKDGKTTGFRVELKKTGKDANVLVFKKLKTNKAVELEDGDA